MLGSHKVANWGYVGVMAVGGFFALQQTLYIANLSDPATDAEQALSLESNETMVTASFAPLPSDPIVRLNKSLQAAESALSAVDALELEEEIVVSKGPSAWQVDAEKQQTPTFMLRDEIREYDVITLSEQATTLPSEGDQMRIPLLNGEEVLVDVKNTRVSGNGDYSWSGHVQGYGSDYPVVMTYGKTSTFAMITTPQGSYSMESVNGVGWLYKNPAEHELTSPGHEDFLEIPEHKQTHITTPEDLIMES